MPRFSLVLASAAVFGGLLFAVPGDLFAQDKVGVKSAVNPEANGTAPGGNARRLVIGQDVVYNEHITTGPAGQTQLLFLDESSMTVGPNSDLTIDQFVYDPKTGNGKLAMSATRGLLRYVGGKLSKQDEAVTLKTSTATLAVRGGAFIVNITPSSTNAVFVYGTGLTVTSNTGGTPQTVSRPGFGTTVAAGSSPSQPGPAPQGELAQYLQSLDGRTGSSGGASTIPSDATVANSGVSNDISGNINNSIQQSQQNSQGQTQGSSNSGSNTSNTVSNSTNNLGTTANAAASCGAAGNCPSGSNQAFTNNGSTTGSSSGNTGNGGSNTNPTQPVSITVAGRLKNTNGNGTTHGFVDQSANADIPYANGTLTFPNGVTSPGVFNGTFNSNGATLGTLSFALASGSATFTGNSSTLGPITGTSFLSADGTFFYANITPTSQPGERLFISGGTAAGTAAFQPTGTTRVFAFTVQPDAALQSNIPFIRGSAGGNLQNASVSPLYVVAPANTPIGSASTTTAARGLQASLAISGQQANQQSVISVTTGVFPTSASGQPTFSGGMRGSSQLSASSPPTRLGSAVSSTIDANGNSFYGGQSNITGFTLDQTQYNQTTPGTLGAAVIPSTASEVPLSGTGATSYGFAQPAVASAVPNGVGTSRTTQALTGNFGGLMYTTAQSTPYAVTGGALIATDAATNRVQGTLAGSAQSPSSGVNTVQMQFGGLSGDSMGRSAFIDNSKFAALESPTAPQQINGQNLVVNGNTADAGKLYMVSSGVAGQPTQLLPSGASFCQCQYLQWGYWGGDLRTGNSADSTISRVDRGNINTWVVGTPTSNADLSNLISIGAQATYTGAAIGSVFNNGASYMAAGGFNGTYNFGTQTGTMAITNFDGRGTVAATGRAPLSGPNYSFSINGTGVSGSINGTFYGPAAAETGGSFALQSAAGLPAYIVSGTFAGKR